MIEIREMQLDDLGDVMEIENDNFSKPWSETGFFTFLIRDDTLFLAAAEDEKIVGYCGVVMAADEGDITNVSVDKKHQNRGIGMQLLENLIQKTQEAGIKKLFLEVRESNTRAIHLYEKMGFVQSGMRRHYYEDPVENAALMMRGQ